MVLPKETPQTPKKNAPAVVGAFFVCFYGFSVVKSGHPGGECVFCIADRALLPAVAALPYKLSTRQRRERSEANRGRPSCAWMQRSAPHQRITSVSEARSATASRRSLAFGQDQRNGVALAPSRGPPPSATNRKCAPRQGRRVARGLCRRRGGRRSRGGRACLRRDRRRCGRTRPSFRGT